MKSLHLTDPHAIMMVGLPGSGKSFFAKQFAETFHMPCIDSRAFASFTKDTPSLQEITAIVANEIVKTGQSFVYEGFTDSRTVRTEFCKWVRKHGYKPIIVWVQVDSETAQDRTLKAYDMTPGDYEEIARKFSPPHASETPVVISGKHTYATQVKAVLSRLTKERASRVIAVRDEPAPASISQKR